MKRFFLTVFLYSICAVLSAQNLGIGTTNPQARLHLKQDFEIMRLQGESPYISFYSSSGSYCGYLWNRNNTAMDLGTPAGSGFPVYISPNNYPTATFLANGNVGLGMLDPAFRLDILGRMRIRHFGETAGIWFNNSLNTTSPAFVGMLDDLHVGLYGTGSGWGFSMNTNTGNISLGADDAASSKLLIQNSGGTALEIAGGIRVSGMAPAFRYPVAVANQADFDPTGAALSVVVDHPLCNNDPNALLFIMPVQLSQPIQLYVRYDAGINKWKIRVSDFTHFVVTGISSPGAVRPCPGGEVCPVLMDVAHVDYFSGFHVGDVFNVIVIKQ